MFINYKREIYALAHLNLSTASFKCLSSCIYFMLLCTRYQPVAVAPAAAAAVAPAAASPEGESMFSYLTNVINNVIKPTHYQTKFT